MKLRDYLHLFEGLDPDLDVLMLDLEDDIVAPPVPRVVPLFTVGNQVETDSQHRALLRYCVTCGNASCSRPGHVRRLETDVPTLAVVLADWVATP